MNIDKIKFLADTIVSKRSKKEKLEKTKNTVDDRSVNGIVTIQIPSIDPKIETISLTVDSVELKKLLDAEIVKQDTASDEAELKKQAK